MAKRKNRADLNDLQQRVHDEDRKVVDAFNSVIWKNFYRDIKLTTQIAPGINGADYVVITANKNSDGLIKAAKECYAAAVDTGYDVKIEQSKDDIRIFIACTDELVQNILENSSDALRDFDDLLKAKIESNRISGFVGTKNADLMEIPASMMAYCESCFLPKASEEIKAAVAPLISLGTKNPHIRMISSEVEKIGSRTADIEEVRSFLAKVNSEKMPESERQLFSRLVHNVPGFKPIVDLMEPQTSVTDAQTQQTAKDEPQIDRSDS